MVQLYSPNAEELEWIKDFGRYANFEPNAGKLSKRLSLEIADLKQATRIIVVYHYLHRGRTMAQLPYWILVDGKKVGVILFAYPRLSVPLFEVPPMNVLELARLWIHPDVQGYSYVDTDEKNHSVSIASCAVGAALKRLQIDWFLKYPNTPEIRAVVSWADDKHHEGTVYKASNFEARKKSGGTLHGSRRRNNGGNDQKNADYLNIKTLWWYEFSKVLSESQKRHIILNKNKLKSKKPIQLGLF